MTWILPTGIVWLLYQLIFKLKISNSLCLAMFPGCVTWQFCYISNGIIRIVTGRYKDFLHVPSSLQYNFWRDAPKLNVSESAILLADLSRRNGKVCSPSCLMHRSLSEIAYSSFKLDVWQLDISFSDFKIKHSFLYLCSGSVIFLISDEIISPPGSLLG